MSIEFNNQRPRKQKATSWANRVGAVGATAMFVVTTAGVSTAMPPPPDPVDPAPVDSHNAGLIETPCFMTPHDWDYAGAEPIPVCHLEFTASTQQEDPRPPLPAHGPAQLSSS